MLLRVRVTLPDRPGALGQVARTLGVAGADIVQVVVLERLGGRAVDDFTVVWPGATRVERLLAGLAAIPGVQVDGVWKAIGAPVNGGHDVLTTLGGKMRQNRIRVLAGDHVTIEVSPYDLTRGRITYRHK